MGLHETRYKGVLGWVDARMPSLLIAFRTHMSEYYAPKNFNVWYFFGSFALVVLVIQIFSGIFLAMHYKPDSNLAFWSVEFIMREVRAAGSSATCIRPAPRSSSSSCTFTCSAACCTAATASRASWSGCSAASSSWP